jgi:quercetin dioxygenase-like cupin family protein
VTGDPGPLTPFRFPDDETEALWFFGELQLILVSGEHTGGAFSVVEHAGPKGLSPPWHRQPGDNETFYMLDGEMTLWVGDPQGRGRRAGPGALVFVPRGTPHSFRIESATARWLTISTPAGHERFYRAGGEPAERRTLPPAGEPDIAKVEAAGRANGVDLLGRPPDAEA